MKIFKIITIATVANGFKLIEDTDYFKGELTITTETAAAGTTTTATTTMDTTTTINATSETATEYGDAEATTATETTTTGEPTANDANPFFEYNLSDSQKLQRLQDIALKKYEEYRFLKTEYSDWESTRFRTILRERYEECVCIILRRLGQKRPNYCNLEPSDSVIETPKLELQSMRQSH